MLQSKIGQNQLVDVQNFTHISETFDRNFDLSLVEKIFNVWASMYFDTTIRQLLKFVSVPHGRSNNALMLMSVQIKETIYGLAARQVLLTIIRDHYMDQ